MHNFISFFVTMAKKVEDYIDERLVDNAKDEEDVTKPTALIRFNRYMHKIENKLAHFVMENFFDEGISMNLVAGQSNYQLPEGDSDNPLIPGIPEFKKLLECSVKYADTGVGAGKKAGELPVGSLEYPLEWYTTNQSNAAPYFRFDNREIRIYPTPTENVTDGLILRYARNDVDVELTTLESELSIPRQYIPTILDGMSYQLKKTNKHTAVIAFYKQEWQESLSDLITELGDRYLQPVQYKNPYLPNLMY